jgi:hypothetical protein
VSSCCSTPPQEIPVCIVVWLRNVCLFLVLRHPLTQVQQDLGHGGRLLRPHSAQPQLRLCGTGWSRQVCTYESVPRGRHMLAGAQQQMNTLLYVVREAPKLLGSAVYSSSACLVCGCYVWQWPPSVLSVSTA